MDPIKYNEMSENLNDLITKGELADRKVFLFGHCNATEELADLLLKNDFVVTSILDNNSSKYGNSYRDIPIVSPDACMNGVSESAVVLIVTRFYEAMNRQLRDLGFKGEVIKLVDYNTYAEYSLSSETVSRKKARLERGKEVLDGLNNKYPGRFRIFCPYSSLGDVYYCMCNLPAFLKKTGHDKAVVCVYTGSCRDVASVFGYVDIEVLPQNDLDAAIQATLYYKDEGGFIAHNDKPYVMNLTKALYYRKITFETLYRCGVFGLPVGEKPALPTDWDEYPHLDEIPEGKSVILAPYAGSVVSLDDDIWAGIRDEYKKKGYEVFTNTAPGESPIDGTRAVSARIREMRSVVERAGTFIGLRSGICDVIRSADCRKIALYPDYNFSDTKWKSIDIFALDDFENIVIKDGSEWKKIL